MLIKKLNEVGYEEALLGLSLSFYDHKEELIDWERMHIEYIPDTCKLETARAYQNKDKAFGIKVEQKEYFWTNERFERAERRAKALAFKGGGHNKFLESIQVWLYVQAPRAWWSEMDTYRIGISKNSSSTMHTLAKRWVTSDDFEEGTLLDMINNFNLCLNDYHMEEGPYYHDMTRLKMNLPESWLQERLINCNYMVLQNIIRQRKGHRLKQWDIFIDSLLSQLDHPELVYKEKE